MPFHWSYQPNGPLFVRLWVTEKCEVKLSVFMKHYDRLYGHNNFFDISKVDVKAAIAHVNAGRCPLCKVGLEFETEDKYNRTCCPECSYEAWSNKIYDYCYEY
jgi:hypothetical protein